MFTSKLETLRDRASENYIPQSDLVTLKEVGEGAFAIGASLGAHGTPHATLRVECRVR